MLMSKNGLVNLVYSFCQVIIERAFPRCIQEAMSKGRAIITTNLPGCRETVEEGANGFLIKPKDINSLKDAMLRFINKPQLIQKWE